MTDTQNEQDKQRNDFEVSYKGRFPNSCLRKDAEGNYLSVYEAIAWNEWQAALSHAAQAKWQPIETAPKDGTLIDLWYPIRGRITNRRWYRKNKFWGGEVGKFDRIATLDEEPTHWIPLPDAPKE